MTIILMNLDFILLFISTSFSFLRMSQALLPESFYRELFAESLIALPVIVSLEVKLSLKK